MIERTAGKPLRPPLTTPGSQNRRMAQVMMQRKHGFRRTVVRLHRAVSALWAIRPCLVCEMTGKCEHREPIVDMMHLGATNAKLRAEMERAGMTGAWYV